MRLSWYSKAVGATDLRKDGQNLWRHIPDDGNHRYSLAMELQQVQILELEPSLTERKAAVMGVRRRSLSKRKRYQCFGGKGRGQ